MPNAGSWYLIIAEVLATSAIKQPEGFSRLLPSLLVLAGYSASFYCLPLVLRTVPVGVAYAVWAGLGIVLITIVGAVLYDQKMDLPQGLGITLSVRGVLVLRSFSNIKA